MSLEDRRRERRARRETAKPIDWTPRNRQATAAELRQPCQFLGKPGRQLPGCKCKGRPRVHRCRHPDIDRDTVEAMPEGCQLTAVRLAALAICEACPLYQTATAAEPIQWAAGVTASRRPGPDLLGNCLATLAAAGWPEPIVFADGDDFDTHGAAAVIRSTPAGALQNFYAAAAELVMRHPHAAHLIAQDDTTFNAHAREYIEANPWPADACLVKLFTAAAEDEPNGWHAIPHDLQMKGAQAYVFPPGQLDDFVRSRHAIEQRHKAERNSEAIDNVVARWARAAAGRQYWHAPSLAEHHGTDQSTLDHDFGKAGRYLGDDFDARELAAMPTVCAVLVTQPHRHHLARVAVDSFRRQNYGSRLLLIVTEETADGERHSLADLADAEVIVPHGLPLGEIRNRAIEAAQHMAPLCIQWDDDDYSGPDRIRNQVAAWRPGRAVLLTRQLRSDLQQGEAKLWKYEPGIEGTILHETATPWRYPADRKGEDTIFAAKFRDAGQLTTLANNPADYVRFYHGANTWDRQHIMRGVSVTAGQAELLDNTRLLYPLHPLDRWQIRLPQIHGWSTALFCRLLLGLMDYQAIRDEAGDVLDIGVHHGRVTIGLAAKLAQLNADRPRDRPRRLDAVDLWPAPGNAQHQARYMDHHAAVFPGEPLSDSTELWKLDSLTLPRTLAQHAPGRRYTLAHVDGAHDNAHAATDIMTAAQLIDPGGFLAVDDVHNPAHPEVGPAFWRIAAAEGLQPFAVCSNRWLCAMDKPTAGRYFQEAKRLAASMKAEAKAPRFQGHPLLVIE